MELGTKLHQLTKGLQNYRTRNQTNMLQSENSIVKTVIQRALHTAYTPIGRNIAYIKSCVSPCCINCAHVNECKLLWNQSKYTDIEVINNGNSINY